MQDSVHQRSRLSPARGNLAGKRVCKRGHRTNTKRRKYMRSWIAMTGKLPSGQMRADQICEITTFESMHECNNVVQFKP